VHAHGALQHDHLRPERIPGDDPFPMQMSDPLDYSVPKHDSKLAWSIANFINGDSKVTIYGIHPPQS